MEFGDFRAFLYRLHADSAGLGAEFDAFISANPLFAVRGLLYVASHPDSAEDSVAYFSMILLGRYSPILSEILTTADAGFQQVLQESISALFSTWSLDPFALRQVSHTAATFASLYEGSEAWVTFMLRQLLAEWDSSPTTLRIALLNCWNEYIERAAINPFPEDYLQSQLKAMFGTSPDPSVFLPLFRTLYVLLIRSSNSEALASEYAPLLLAFASSMEGNDILGQLFHDLYSFVDEEGCAFLNSVAIDFIQLLRRFLPTLEKSARVYGLRTLTNLYSHFRSEILQAATPGDMEHPILFPLVYLLIELLVGCDFSTDPAALKEDLLFDAIVDGLAELRETYDISDDWSCQIETACEQIDAVEWPYQCALFVLIERSSPPLARWIGDRMLYFRRIMSAAASDNAYVRYYALCALQPLSDIDSSVFDEGEFDAVLPSLVAWMEAETVSVNQQLVLSAIASFCSTVPAVPSEYVADLVGLVGSHAESGPPAEQMVSLVKILAECTASPEFAPLAMSVFPFFEAILRDGSGFDRSVFFAWLQELPRFRSSLPAEVFEPFVHQLIQDLLSSPPDALAVGERDSVNRFLAALVRDRIGVLGQILPQILDFAGQTISQLPQRFALSAEECSSLYIAIDTSMSTGLKVCYSTSELSNAAEGFRTLSECLDTANPALATVVPSLLGVCLPWLEVPFITDEMTFATALVGLGMIPYFDFADARFHPAFDQIYTYALSSILWLKEKWDFKQILLSLVSDVFQYLVRFCPDNVTAVQHTAETIARVYAGSLRELAKFEKTLEQCEMAYDERDVEYLHLALGRLVFAFGRGCPHLIGELYGIIERHGDVFSFMLIGACLAFASHVETPAYFMSYLQNMLEVLGAGPHHHRTAVCALFALIAQEHALPIEIVPPLLELAANPEASWTDAAEDLRTQFIFLLLAIIHSFPDAAEHAIPACLNLLPHRLVCYSGSVSPVVPDLANLIRRYFIGLDNKHQNDIMALGNALARFIVRPDVMAELEEALRCEAIDSIIDAASGIR
jgi:hypothetical protein